VGYYWSFPAPRPRTADGALRNVGVFCPRGLEPGEPGEPGAGTAGAREALRRRLRAGGHGTADVRTAVQWLWAPQRAAEALHRPLLAPAAGPPASVSHSPPSSLRCVGEALGADPITGEGLAAALLQGAAVADPRAAAAVARLVRHLNQSARLAPVIYGGFSATLADRLLFAPALVDRVLARFCDTPGPPGQTRRALWQLLRGG
jgi:hypothetical protein